jgi:hypothetical protein
LFQDVNIASKTIQVFGEVFDGLFASESDGSVAAVG